LAAALHQIPDADRAAEAAIETVNLASVEERSISTYSRGMRQRIRLAASIVHQPEILFLDEPLSGTDPRQRIEFQRFLREYADQGRTVIVSSHILEEVETLADRILLLISGKLAASGDFRAIRSRLDQRPYKVLVECSNPRRLAARLVALEAVESVYIDDQQRLTLLSRQVGVLQKAIPRLAKEEGVRVNRVEPLDDSLESVFTYLVEG
jgi:ABC-2 type transport system ATP-binding protein